MQKFGLDSQKARRLNAFELEIVREQATSLGRAGKKLRLSLERYQNRFSGQSMTEKKTLLNEISNNVWELSLQREFVGMIHNNLIWICENYDIPKEALNRIGAR